MTYLDYLLMALAETATVSAVFMLGCWFGDALDRREDRK